MLLGPATEWAVSDVSRHMGLSECTRVAEPLFVERSDRNGVIEAVFDVDYQNQGL